VIAIAAVSLVSILALGSCLTFAGQHAGEDGSAGDTVSEMVPDENSGVTLPESEEEIPPEDLPTFRVTDEYWLATPWFNVSAVVLMVGRTNPPTTIVIPESSPMREFMRNERGVVVGEAHGARRDRFVLRLGVQLGDAPAFLDDARLRQSFLYE
jgi:hypothetical protein